MSHADLLGCGHDADETSLLVVAVHGLAHLAGLVPGPGLAPVAGVADQEAGQARIAQNPAMRTNSPCCQHSITVELGDFLAKPPQFPDAGVEITILGHSRFGVCVCVRACVCVYVCLCDEEEGEEARREREVEADGERRRGIVCWLVG